MADEWFGPLHGFPSIEVWDAIERHRRTITPGRDGLPVGRWRPELADILACIDANWRERSAARREAEAITARAASNGRGGVRPHPETKQIGELLARSKGMPGDPDYLEPKLARERIDALVVQMDQRLEREEAGTLT